MDSIAGVEFIGLKKIPTPKGGCVYHGLKASEQSFKGFGEAYFSSLLPDQVKGWKRHNRMTLNLITITGSIEFTLYDLREGSITYGTICKYLLSRENYNRLTIPPGIWFAFKGIGQSENILLDIINEEHDPTEAECLPLEAFDILL